VFFGYPTMTFGVVAKIHWQALKLFFKRVPFQSKPRPGDLQMSTQPSSPSSLRSPAVSWFIRPLLRTDRALRKPAAVNCARGAPAFKPASYGVLEVHLPDGTARRFGQAPEAGGNPPYARVVLTSWNVCAAALTSGDVGFAETYLAGDWHTDDLTELLDIMVRNHTDTRRCATREIPAPPERTGTRWRQSKRAGNRLRLARIRATWCK
jgi:hypothetical protein